MYYTTFPVGWEGGVVVEKILYTTHFNFRIYRTTPNAVVGVKELLPSVVLSSDMKTSIDIDEIRPIYGDH